MSAPVDVVSTISALAAIVRLHEGNRDAEVNALLECADSCCAAVAELIDRADSVATTFEMPTLVKQSTKNPNAGFIDWRDWCALKGEVAELRAALALARVGGEA